MIYCMDYNMVFVRTQLLELVEKLCRKVSICHQVDLVFARFKQGLRQGNHLKLLFKLSTHGIEMFKRPAIPWSQKCIYVYTKYKIQIHLYSAKLYNEIFCCALHSSFSYRIYTVNYRIFQTNEFSVCF